MFRRGSSSGVSNDASDAPPALDIGGPTDSQHGASVVKLDGALIGSDAVPQAVLAMLPSFRPVEISGPTDVQRRSSVQVTETGELRASASVPKEVLAMLPSAAIGSVDISAPRGVTSRGSVTAGDSGKFDISGPLSGQLADIYDMLPTVANQDALRPASVARVRDAFCASGSAAPQRALSAQELLVCMERLNARRPPAWAAECASWEAQFALSRTTSELTRVTSRKSTPHIFAGLMRHPSHEPATPRTLQKEPATGKQRMPAGDRRFSIEMVLRCVSRELEAGGVYGIFEEYADGQQLDKESFLRFCRQEQGADEVEAERAWAKAAGLRTADDDESNVGRSEASTLAEASASAKLSLPRFAAWLLSAHNEALAPEHASVCQDMSRPLSEYFIASSHNSYLTGNQLRSESSADMYRRQLLMGYRCVELDCWDGTDGEPEITHGHTLCTRIKFVDVAVALADSGFVASPYPLILSLEMHCCWEQQLKIAAILKMALGERLLTAPSLEPGTDAPLPSPEALRGKVLVKAKRRGRLDASVAVVEPPRQHASATPDGRAGSTAGSAWDATPPITEHLSTAAAPSALPLPTLPRIAPADSESDSDGSPRPPPLPSGLQPTSPTSLTSPTSPRLPPPPPPEAFLSSRCSSSTFSLGATEGAADAEEMARQVAGKAAWLATVAEATAAEAEAVVDEPDVLAGSAEVAPAVEPGGSAFWRRAPTCAELAAVCYLPADKFALSREMAERPMRSTTSLAELLLEKHAAEARTTMLLHTRRHLVRIYPDKVRQQTLSTLQPSQTKPATPTPPGRRPMRPQAVTPCIRGCSPVCQRLLPLFQARQDSSNFEPCVAWGVGCQMVCMNTQTWDLGMRLERAKFALNGNCGYVLRPARDFAAAEAALKMVEARRAHDRDARKATRRHSPAAAAPTRRQSKSLEEEGPSPSRKPLLERRSTEPGRGYDPGWSRSLEADAASAGLPPAGLRQLDQSEVAQAVEAAGVARAAEAAARFEQVLASLALPAAAAEEMRSFDHAKKRQLVAMHSAGRVAARTRSTRY